MLPLLLRVIVSLSAKCQLPPLPARRVIAAAGGAIAAVAALMALPSPAPRAGGAPADFPAESARPAAASDPDVYLGWADVPEWRIRRSRVDDLPNRRRRRGQITPHRRSPAVAERSTAEARRATPPARPAPEPEPRRARPQPAAAPPPLPRLELAFAGPYTAAAAARDTASEEAPRPDPGAEASPEPAPRSQPPPRYAATPASPPAPVQPAPPRPPTPAAIEPPAPKAAKPRTPVTAPPSAGPPSAAPGSPIRPTTPRVGSGPSSHPGGFPTPSGVTPPPISDRSFGKNFGNGLDDIVDSAAKGAGHDPVDLFIGPQGPFDGHGHADELVEALLADNLDSGPGKALDAPAFSSEKALPPGVDVHGGGDMRASRLLPSTAPVTIPEPGTAPLLALGLALLARRPGRQIRR